MSPINTFKNTFKIKKNNILDINQSLEKKCNLIYGYNGYGKTTISRTFQDLNEGKKDTEVNFFGNDDLKGKVIVFNSDFVRNVIGKSEMPEVIIVSKNANKLTEDLNKIKEKEKEIETLKDKWSEKIKEIDALYTSNAKDIAEKLSYANNFKINQLKSSLSNLSSKDTNLSSKDKYEADFKQDKINNLSWSISLPELESDEKINDKLKEVINETQVKSLSENFKTWVKQGLDLHKNEESCQFCNNQISHERRNELEEFFNNEAQKQKQALGEMQEGLTKGLNKILSELNKISGLKVDNNDIKIEDIGGRVILNLKEDYNRALNNTKICFDTFEENINKAINSIQNKLEGKEFEEVKFSQSYNNLKTIVQNLNNIKDQSNEEIKKIDYNKETAKKELTKIYADEKYQNKIKPVEEEKKQNMLKIIEDYNKKQDKEEMKLQLSSKITSYQDLTKAINFDNIKKNLEKEKERINDELKKNETDVEKLNDNLQILFGSVKFSFKKKEKGGYIIIRNGDKISDIEKSLSEGEKTAIAISYFVAKFEDFIKDKSDIFLIIDDPISSLDENIIYNAHSLIWKLVEEKENSIAKTIILTHNWHFGYLISKIGKVNNGKFNVYLLSRENGTTTMKYEERLFEEKYIFYFNKVYEYSRKEKIQQDDLYILGNFIRKLTESFFRFKYGAGHLNDTKLPKKSLLIEAYKHAVNRFANDESHSKIIDDFKPLECQSINIAQATLEIIKEYDKEHYEAMIPKI